MLDKDDDDDTIINQETLFPDLDDDQTDNMENKKVQETENEKTTKKVTFQDVGDQTNQINENNQMIEDDDDDDDDDTLATGTTNNNNNSTLSLTDLQNAFEDGMKLLI